MGENYLLDKLDLEGFKINYTYNDFRITIDKPIFEQLMDLDEDILQLQIDDKYTIDLGYYPEHTLNGRFKIFIVSEHNWTNPVWEKSFVEPNLIIEYFQEAVDIVKNMLV
jgi:hypothetical protein